MALPESETNGDRSRHLRLQRPQAAPGQVERVVVAVSDDRPAGHRAGVQQRAIDGVFGRVLVDGPRLHGVIGEEGQPRLVAGHADQIEAALFLGRDIEEAGAELVGSPQLAVADRAEVDQRACEGVDLGIEGDEPGCDMGRIVAGAVLVDVEGDGKAIAHVERAAQRHRHDLGMAGVGRLGDGDDGRLIVDGPAVDRFGDHQKVDVDRLSRDGHDISDRSGRGLLVGIGVDERSQASGHDAEAGRVAANDAIVPSRHHRAVEEMVGIAVGEGRDCVNFAIVQADVIERRHGGNERRRTRELLIGDARRNRDRPRRR